MLSCPADAQILSHFYSILQANREENRNSKLSEARLYMANIFLNEIRPFVVPLCCCTADKKRVKSQDNM